MIVQELSDIRDYLFQVYFPPEHSFNGQLLSDVLPAYLH